MKQWFLSLAPRERLVVGVGGGVVVLVLLYVLLIEPFVQGIAERERRIARLEEDLAWMVDAASEVAALRETGATTNEIDGDQPVYLAIDDAVSEAGLPQPDELAPDGSDTARVEFDEVAFDRLMGVIADLESQSGIVVTRARFERQEEGIVRARLTLERDT